MIDGSRCGGWLGQPRQACHHAIPPPLHPVGPPFPGLAQPGRATSDPLPSPMQRLRIDCRYTNLHFKFSREGSISSRTHKMAMRSRSGRHKRPGCRRLLEGKPSTGTGASTFKRRISSSGPTCGSARCSPQCRPAPAVVQGTAHGAGQVRWQPPGHTQAQANGTHVAQGKTASTVA